MNIYEAIYSKTAALNDQKEALIDPFLARMFAELNIPGTDIKKCQEKACEDPREAFYFAKYIKGANIEYCQKYACKNYHYALWFAEKIPGADIAYCSRAFEYSGYYIRRFNQIIVKKIML